MKITTNSTNSTTQFTDTDPLMTMRKSWRYKLYGVRSWFIVRLSVKLWNAGEILKKWSEKIAGL